MKRLGQYETSHKIDSEDFFHRYSHGKMPDDAVFVEWANDYLHYISLRHALEALLQNVSRSLEATS